MPRFDIRVRFEQGDFFTACEESRSLPYPGDEIEEAAMPSICGVDDSWTSVTVESDDMFRCRGRGTHLAEDIPVRIGGT